MRKSAVGGGPIYDLAAEEATTDAGLAVSYFHLRLTLDHLLWTRETTGLYYWTGATGTPLLMSLPTSGGSPSRVFSGSFAPGLVADGARLYWAPAEKQIVSLTPGGTPNLLATKVRGTATLGGLAPDPEALYYVRKKGSRYTIFRISR